MVDGESSTTMAGRKRSAGGATLALTVLLALIAATVSFAAGEADPDGSYIVVLENSIDDPGAVGREQTERAGGELGFVYRYGPIGYSATLPDDEAEALKRDPRVRAVRPDHVAFAASQSPSTGIERISAFGNKALQIDEENNFWVNADVAVIDAGFKVGGDLNVVKRTFCTTVEMVTKCKDGEGDDEASGHGTGVASALAAVDNKEGVVGVAPGARLWSVKVLNPTATESKIVAGINWVIANAKEIEVANMSIQCALPCPNRPTYSEAVKNAVAKGIVFVVAAGNESGDASESGYANDPEVITVSGIADYDGVSSGATEAVWVPSCNAEKQAGDTGKVGEDDMLYAKSNYGEPIDMTAPAVCIRTLNPSGGLSYNTGTSFAAPDVAAAAAILAAQSNPNTKEDVEAIRKKLISAANFNWFDSSEDGFWEPLLGMSDEKVFK